MREAGCTGISSLYVFNLFISMTLISRRCDSLMFDEHGQLRCEAITRRRRAPPVIRPTIVRRIDRTLRSPDEPFPSRNSQAARCDRFQHWMRQCWCGGVEAGVAVYRGGSRVVRGRDEGYVGVGRGNGVMKSIDLVGRRDPRQTVGERMTRISRIRPIARALVARGP